MASLIQAHLLLFGVVLLSPLLGGCQIGYLTRSAWHHLSMMSQRTPVEKALRDPELSEDEKRKLRLAEEAREFSIKTMGLKKSDNYTTYIRLDRPYVTWVVSAAPRWTLEHHLWKYPVVGAMPYKGFPTEAEAQAEKKSLEKMNYDVFLRGVSAYSTLGWFSDSILSTMMRYKDHDLVNTIIHENMHATLYIRNSADFNERLAVFVGTKGAQQFYTLKEGADSPTAKLIDDEQHDDRLFSAFIGPELEALKIWYASLAPEGRTEEHRTTRLKEIHERLQKNLMPLMKTRQYARFPEIPNNARLLYYKTYFQDLAVFERLWILSDQSWPLFMRCIRSLERSKNPETDLVRLNETLSKNERPIDEACGDTK